MLLTNVIYTQPVYCKHGSLGKWKEISEKLFCDTLALKCTVFFVSEGQGAVNWAGRNGNSLQRLEEALH
jgi:hypothetical protein